MFLAVNPHYVNEEAYSEEVEDFNDAEDAAAQEQATRAPNRRCKRYARHQYKTARYVIFRYVTHLTYRSVSLPSSSSYIILEYVSNETVNRYVTQNLMIESFRRNLVQKCVSL